MNINRIEEIKKTRHFDFPILAGVFCTLAVLTNSVGVKLFDFYGLTLPVSILWFPLTFLLTDIVSEVYGEKSAFLLVMLGFFMNLVLLMLSLIGLWLPTSPFYAAASAYDVIFSANWRLFAASMTAYLVAQSIDVKIFHWLKYLSHDRHLWLRNNLSTMTSQLFDSFIVSFIFLYGNDAIFNGGFEDILKVSFDTYKVKFVIALLDTPFCYWGVSFFRRRL